MSRGSIEIPLRDTDEVNPAYNVVFFFYSTLFSIDHTTMLALHAN